MKSVGGKYDFWEPHEVSRLRTMWRHGYSGAQIAKALGRTLGSVRGQLHRLKLKRKEKQ